MLKKSLDEYRKGATGALMDEYERAAFELKALIENIGEAEYPRIVEGESEHCCSIRIIMNHVVRAGYGYAKYTRDALSMNALPIEDKQIEQSEIGGEIDKMLAYTAEIFEGKWEMMDEEMESIYFKTRWEVTYNIDQLFEHAIVHILRHRRQIEKFLLKFQS
ncbi:MAG: DinB family protein [Pyrinomonadaceae bacterium]|nr:DinB family protein [Pyrinomonadaceae bacterium]